MQIRIRAPSLVSQAVVGQMLSEWAVRDSIKQKVRAMIAGL